MSDSEGSSEKKYDQPAEDERDFKAPPVLKFPYVSELEKQDYDYNLAREFYIDVRLHPYLRS